MIKKNVFLFLLFLSQLTQRAVGGELLNDSKQREWKSAEIVEALALADFTPRTGKNAFENLISSTNLSQVSQQRFMDFVCDKSSFLEKALKIYNWKEQVKELTKEYVIRKVVPESVEQAYDATKDTINNTKDKIVNVIDGNFMGDYNCETMEERFKLIVADLSSKKTFSLLDAINVCAMYLPYDSSPDVTNSLKGRNISFKSGCRSFIYNLVRIAESKSLASNSNTALKSCLNMVNSTPEVIKPVLCGGTCDMTGNDKVTLMYKYRDSVQVVVEDVDDFCDGELMKKASTGWGGFTNMFRSEKKDTKQWFFIDKNGNAKDVSNLSDNERNNLLK